jgi:predicted alpha/beta-fold hydrolase
VTQSAPARSVPPFRPLFRSPHLQTVIANYWRRPRPEATAAVTRRFFATDPNVQVLVESQRPAGPARGHLLLVHGLEGSSMSGYMTSLACAAVRAGFASHRLNLRSCGGTAHLSPTLYHGGLTADALSVLQQLHAEEPLPVHVAGFSLGGNIVLKLAAELGSSVAWLRRVAAVSTPMDLAVSVDRMRRFDNWIYERRFIFHMLRRVRSTGRFSRRDLAGITSLFEFDNRITAPEFGFGGAANYYRTQSSIGFIEAIRVPTLLIQSKDDTYVPFEIYERAAVRANPSITVLATDHGGHLGFLARGPQRFWLDEAIVDWFQ